jgi:5-methylcytosine-specific restriction enzyme A
MVIKAIKHGINLVRNHFRDIGTGATRSPQWKTVEKHFLEEHPTCEACGGTERLNVHHVQPFHKFPELELEPSNLMTLCMSQDREDHLKIGHGSSFKTYNPTAREDAKQAFQFPDDYDQLVMKAKANRVPN